MAQTEKQNEHAVSQSALTGLVILPDSLTAENGAKHLLSAEFIESDTHTCIHCIGDAEGDDCEVCDGSGEVVYSLPVQWTTIKDIYAMIVKNMAKEIHPIENSAKIIDEFTSCIPEHIEGMPAISSNGVTRSEMEWKHIAIGMAKEIELLRSKAI
ncbi:MAG: hypothetical protein JRJ62_00205 [Deltaproteobacteria bacterium]|nr:hypothetical protein [Deltaproteobacteria bacterium]